MKNIQLRHFAFTCNNYTAKSIDCIRKARISLEFSYLIYGKEIGDIGTPHLQGYVQLKKRKYFKSVVGALPGFHITICKGNSQENIDYCKKDNKTFELGIARSVGGKVKQKEDWQELCELAMSGEHDKIMESNPGKFVKYYRTWKNIGVDYNKAKPNPDRLCLWIYGAPGTGKSLMAHSLWPEAYWKNANKWWDGYAGEETVILDDLGTCHLYEYLKRWADKYPVLGEIKGSSIGLTYNTLVVTSNFNIKELGSSIELVTVAAVQRRFLQVLVVRPFVVEGLITDLIVEVLGVPGELSLRELLKGNGFF